MDGSCAAGRPGWSPAITQDTSRGRASAADVQALLRLPQENYYRPPGQDACLPCDCFPHGSHSRACDMDSGQCSCKPGVIGRQCNRCDNPFAEVAVLGCEGPRRPPPAPAWGRDRPCVSASGGRGVHACTALSWAWGRPTALRAYCVCLAF